MSKIEYEPYSCEVCKMCEIQGFGMLSGAKVICKKYECYLYKSNNLKDVNDRTFLELERGIGCKKSYPSKWKIFKFNRRNVVDKEMTSVINDMSKGEKLWELLLLLFLALLPGYLYWV